MLSCPDDRKPAPHGLPLAEKSRDPRYAVRRQWVGGNLAVTERAHPAAKRRQPARIDVSEPVARDEIDRLGDVTAGRA